MHRWSGTLAFMAGAALITTITGTALAQEESPAPEASMAASASQLPEEVTPSTLGILQVATDKTAGTKLEGKKYAKAIAKAAPAAVGYLINTAGVDNIDRIIELSRAARAVDEAGDAKAAKALIDMATLLYRNEWTKTKSDPVTLNGAIEEVIAAGDYPEQDPALALWSFGNLGEGLEGLMDICLWQEGIQSMYSPAEPSLCEDNKGRQVRVDLSLVDEAKNSTKDLYSADPKTADVGGLGIHKVVQDKSANDKLAGKKYKKALAKTMKKSGPAVAGYYADGSGAGRMNGIFDLLSLAREADEAGNAKAAKALMSLALAAYREGLTNSDQAPEAFNTALSELGYEIYDGESAFALFPPGGMEDICLSNKKEGDGWLISPAELWLCAKAGGKVLRVSQDGVDNSKNGMPGFYKGDS